MTSTSGVISSTASVEVIRLHPNSSLRTQYEWCGPIQETRVLKERLSSLQSLIGALFQTPDYGDASAALLKEVRSWENRPISRTT